MSLGACLATPPASGAERQHLLAEMERLLPQLRRYTRYLESNVSMADDLLQESLLHAIDGLEGFKPGTNLRAWLFTIVRNTQISIWRKGGNRCLRDLRLPEEKAAASQPHRVALGELAGAISRLPTQQRETLLLAAVEGLSYEETAAIMGTPVGTVRSRLSRARAALWNYMDGAVAKVG